MARGGSQRVPARPWGRGGHGRGQLCRRGREEGSQLGYPWQARGWQGGSRLDLWGHLLLELCCPPLAIRGTAPCQAPSLQVCACYPALPLDTQGPHLYANHLWGPSQQGYIENLHFLSLKLALWVSGEWTRCPTWAHRKPFPSWGQCRHQSWPSGSGPAHRCCFSATHLREGEDAAQHRLQGFLKRCHLTLEMRGTSGPQRPSASPGWLVPRGGGRPHRRHPSRARRGEQQPGADTAPPGAGQEPPATPPSAPTVPTQGTAP